MKFPEVGTYVGIAHKDFIGTYIVEAIDEELGKVKIVFPDGGSKLIDVDLVHNANGATPHSRHSSRSYHRRRYS